jgi:hypothetical protein
VFSADVDTAAYRQDPVPVTRIGNFHIQGAVLDAYGAVVHYVIGGTIRGNHATGSLRSYRFDYAGNIGDSAVVKCSNSKRWSSVRNSTASASGPLAFFDVVPFRFGHAGEWTYYLIVKVTACSHANRVRAGILGGPSLTIGCGGQAKLGPLTPKRTYSVVITALLTRRG